MRVEESPPAVEALTYLRAWLKATYDAADDWRIKSLRARLDDSSTDALRADCARRAIDAEDLGGRLSHLTELLERDLADRTRRRAPMPPVTHWRFSDAGAWVEPGDDL